MQSTTLSPQLRSELLKFLKKTKQPELVTTYLLYIEKKFDIKPILFPKEKMIYRDINALTRALEDKDELWHKTEIKIQFGQPTVNARTKKIYICPFTGKVFGDNTCPNPQDAIYNWVAKCPENTERVGGLPAKRFFVSEDPEIIKNYITERKKAITKTVYSSAVSKKLFNTKQAVIADFKKNHVKQMNFTEVQNQNRFEIEPTFLEYIQKELTEDKITKFVEMLSEFEEFEDYVNQWLEQ